MRRVSRTADASFFELGIFWLDRVGSESAYMFRKWELENIHIAKIALDFQLFSLLILGQ